MQLPGRHLLLSRLRAHAWRSLGSARQSVSQHTGQGCVLLGQALALGSESRQLGGRDSSKRMSIRSVVVHMASAGAPLSHCR